LNLFRLFPAQLSAIGTQDTRAVHRHNVSVFHPLGAQYNTQHNGYSLIQRESLHNALILPFSFERDPILYAITYLLVKLHDNIIIFVNGKAIHASMSRRAMSCNSAELTFSSSGSPMQIRVLQIGQTLSPRLFWPRSKDTCTATNHGQMESWAYIVRRNRSFNCSLG